MKTFRDMMEAAAKDKNGKPLKVGDPVAVDKDSGPYNNEGSVAKITAIGPKGTLTLKSDKWTDRNVPSKVVRYWGKK